MKDYWAHTWMYGHVWPAQNSRIVYFVFRYIRQLKFFPQIEYIQFFWWSLHFFLKSSSKHFYFSEHFAVRRPFCPKNFILHVISLCSGTNWKLGIPQSKEIIKSCAFNMGFLQPTPKISQPWFFCLLVMLVFRTTYIIYGNWERPPLDWKFSGMSNRNGMLN